MLEMSSIANEPLKIIINDLDPDLDHDHQYDHDLDLGKEDLRDILDLQKDFLDLQKDFLDLLYLFQGVPILEMLEIGMKDFTARGRL